MTGEVLKAEELRHRWNSAKMAGVDITTDKPLLNTIDHIGNIIDEIIELTENRGLEVIMSPITLRIRRFLSTIHKIN